MQRVRGADVVLRGRGPQRTERGAAAVEFAIVVPMLLMLVFGVIHFGVAMAQKASMNSAVRSGARYGTVNLYTSSIDPHSCYKTIARAKEGVLTLGLDAASVNWNVYRGTSESTALASTALCDKNTTATSTAGLKPPCQGGTDSDNLYVVADFTSSLIGIPGTGVGKTMTFQSIGVYRCEYTS